MTEEKFTLTWEDFSGNTRNALFQSFYNESFSDVTLVCEDEEIKAHKLILGINSLVLRNILKNNPDGRQIIYLRGVKMIDLKCVLQFIYK